MFTGIIEEVGKIISIGSGKVQRFDISSRLGNKIGDSIAVQGICLTVIDLVPNGFSVEAMRQTSNITTLPEWRVNDSVNLERALTVNSRLGGHIVLGHIDEMAKLVRKTNNEYYFPITPQNRKYIIPKGCISINGASLTIGRVTQSTFSVSLVPYTLKNTTLGMLKIGNKVNMEYDYLVKILKCI